MKTRTFDEYCDLEARERRAKSDRHYDDWSGPIDEDYNPDVADLVNEDQSFASMDDLF